MSGTFLEPRRNSLFVPFRRDAIGVHLQASTFSTESRRGSPHLYKQLTYSVKVKSITSPLTLLLPSSAFRMSI